VEDVEKELSDVDGAAEAELDATPKLKPEAGAVAGLGVAPKLKAGTEPLGVLTDFNVAADLAEGLLPNWKPVAGLEAAAGAAALPKVKVIHSFLTHLAWLLGVFWGYYGYYYYV
jgi:hypothetical protein